LSKVTNIITSKGVHLDVNLSSKYYTLSKDVQNTIKEFNNDQGFFGYSKTPKKWSHSNIEVIELEKLMLKHINLIIDNQPFLYPDPKTYHYQKYPKINLLSISDFTIDIEDEIYLFSFDEDVIFEEIESAETLLLESKSGNKYFGVDFDYGDDNSIEFTVEPSSTDKIPGKVLSHRKMDDGSVEILMKWKYLSYEDSSWVNFEPYKTLLFVKEYFNKVDH